MPFSFNNISSHVRKTHSIDIKSYKRLYMGLDPDKSYHSLIKGIEEKNENADLLSAAEIIALEDNADEGDNLDNTTNIEDKKETISNQSMTIKAKPIDEVEQKDDVVKSVSDHNTVDVNAHMPITETKKTSVIIPGKAVQESKYDNLKEMCQIRCKVCHRDVFSCLIEAHIATNHSEMKGKYGEYMYSRTSYHRWDIYLNILCTLFNIFSCIF